MIYKNSEIKKKYIQLHNVKLTFGANGIYIIGGKNGCGKTTLLESVLFSVKELIKSLYIKKSFWSLMIQGYV